MTAVKFLFWVMAALMALSKKGASMRIRGTFSLSARKLESGRVVYYYQCYDENGKRTPMLSTGLTKKTLAFEYCMKLYREGTLVPRKKAVTFGEYALGWFDKETCAYLKWRGINNPLSDGTIFIHKNSLENHLKPYFENTRLTDITPEAVEKWFSFMMTKKVKDQKGNEKTLKNSSIHCGLFTLKTMMAEAVRRKLISENPIERVRKPKQEVKDIEILKLSEVKAIFPAQWDSVWDSKLAYIANKFMAFTGMRIGEMLGLRGEHIHSDYIHVCGQYGKTGFTKTKTQESRDIPISEAMRSELQELIDLNGDGYLISANGGETPISRTFLYSGYKAALEKAGIDKKQREKRGLTVHSWRHFFNTLLRASDIADGKVRKVTGHKSVRMTEHYTHFDSREFSDVRKVQQELLTEPQRKQRETKTA